MCMWIVFRLLRRDLQSFQQFLENQLDIFFLSQHLFKDEIKGDITKGRRMRENILFLLHHTECGNNAYNRKLLSHFSNSQYRHSSNKATRENYREGTGEKEGMIDSAYERENGCATFTRDRR